MMPTHQYKDSAAGEEPHQRQNLADSNRSDCTNKNFERETDARDIKLPGWGRVQRCKPEDNCVCLESPAQRQKGLEGELKFWKCIDVMIVLYFHKEGHKPLGPVLDGLVEILKKEAEKKRDLDDNNLCDLLGGGGGIRWAVGSPASGRRVGGW